MCKCTITLITRGNHDPHHPIPRIHDSIAEDTPEYAVYGPDTWGLVDELQGGVIAYFHRESADLFRPFLRVTA